MTIRFWLYVAVVFSLCAGTRPAAASVAPQAAAPLAPQADELASPQLRITWDEFKKLYDEKKAVVIDVRSEDAFAAGHIPGARSIPLDQIEERAAELKKLKKPIVLYCA